MINISWINRNKSFRFSIFTIVAYMHSYKSPPIHCPSKTGAGGVRSPAPPWVLQVTWDVFRYTLKSELKLSGGPQGGRGDAWIPGKGHGRTRGLRASHDAAGRLGLDDELCGTWAWDFRVMRTGISVSCCVYQFGWFSFR